MTPNQKFYNYLYKRTGGENELEEYCIKWLINNLERYDDIQMLMQDLQEHGCASGMVPEMVYYSDTLDFFQKYDDEINDLVYALDITDMASFFRNRDKTDPLIQEKTNQNLLAWFGFEETMYRIATEIGLLD